VGRVVVKSAADGRSRNRNFGVCGAVVQEHFAPVKDQSFKKYHIRDLARNFVTEWSQKNRK
jgi:hypothetical protein